MKFKSYGLSLLITTVFLPLAACKTKNAASSMQDASGGPSGLSTASYCTKEGGTQDVLVDCGNPNTCQQALSSAQLRSTLPSVFFCQFDQSVIIDDTFTKSYQRVQNPQLGSPLAVQMYLTHDQFEPNSHLNQPADYYCTEVAGATLHMYITPLGGEANFCQFSDGSSIGDWTLYYGSGTDAPPGYQRLIKLLHSFQVVPPGSTSGSSEGNSSPATE